MQIQISSEDFEPTPSRKIRGAALLAITAAAALLLTTLWPADGRANGTVPGTAKLISLSNSVAHAATKKKTAAKHKKTKKQKKKKKKKKAATLCIKKKKVHGKKVTVYKTVKVYTRVKRGGRYVTVVTKKRVPVKVKCGKSTAGTQNLGVPIKITLDPAKSYATLDFYSFTRQTPISGSVSGFIPGSFVQGQANTVNITRGHINVAQAPVFIDDLCNGQVSAAVQTGKQTYADVDQSKKSTANISVAGSVQGSLNLSLHVNVELRHGDLGCNSPYLTTGYTTLPVSFHIFGKLFGFTTTLDTPDTILDNLGVCIWPGADTQPCSGYEIPLPIGLATHVVGSVSIG